MSEKIASVAWPDEHRVAAIVVNYRTAQLTVACVDSLLASAGVQPQVIVVDNASGDESASTFARQFEGHSRVTVIPRAVNDGYTGGNNAGIAAARRMGASFAFVLNSDTTVDPACLRELVDEADRGAPDVALVSPRIFFSTEEEGLWFGGARFSPWIGLPKHVGWRRAAREGWSERSELPFATGCALLVRLDLVTGDIFDPSLFSYSEDLDLSLRVREAGQRIRFVPTATVWHHDGASHRRAGGQALRFYLGTRNLLRVLGRHARWYHWVTLGPVLLVDVIGRFCLVALRDRDAASFAAVLRGVLHSVSGGRHPIERDSAPISAGAAPALPRRLRPQ